MLAAQAHGFAFQEVVLTHFQIAEAYGLLPSRTRRKCGMGSLLSDDLQGCKQRNSESIVYIATITSIYITITNFIKNKWRTTVTAASRQ